MNKDKSMLSNDPGALSYTPVATHLSKMSYGLSKQIYDNLDKQSKACWLQASHRYYRFFKRDLNQALMTELNTYILHGEEKKAIAMIRNYPLRLLNQGTAVDYSGRIFKQITPFQAALLSHDIVLAQKIAPYFDLLPDGFDEMIKQFYHLFPGGWPTQTAYDFNPLAQVITQSSDSDVLISIKNPLDQTLILGQSLNHFRNEFVQLSLKEQFFNPQHLIKAFDVFALNHAWPNLKIRLYWIQVIGYLQRFLPACYAQAFAQGLYLLIGKKYSLTRSLVVHNTATSWFPIAQSTGLGFDFSIFGCYKSAIERFITPYKSIFMLTTLKKGILVSYVEQIRQQYECYNCKDFNKLI